MGVTAAAPQETTGSFCRTPSETATPLRQLPKTVCVFCCCCFQSFHTDLTITNHLMGCLLFLFFCRGKSKQHLSWQYNSLIQATFVQPLNCLAPLVGRFQTPHFLQTHNGHQDWSFIPSWIQTRFCRLRSSNTWGGNQHPDTWLGTALAVFYTDVSAVRSSNCFKHVCVTS